MWLKLSERLIDRIAVRRRPPKAAPKSAAAAYASGQISPPLRKLRGLELRAEQLLNSHTYNAQSKVTFAGKRPRGLGGQGWWAASDSHRHILDEVAEFYQHCSYPHTDVRVLVAKNVVVYVLGTNHANGQCKSDVVDVIEKLRPHSVLVELCPQRACACDKHASNAFQTTPTFTFKYLRATINQLGFLPAIIFFTDVFREHLASSSARQTNDSDTQLHWKRESLMNYGGEFVAAMTAAQSQGNCRIMLADRPIAITVKRQASVMGNWRGLKVTFHVTLALLLKKRMRSLMMKANRLVFDDPKSYEVLVFERDLYLTHSIQKAAQQLESQKGIRRIVAVIGQGHMKGIQSYWGKVPTEFMPLITSPYSLLDQ